MSTARNCYLHVGTGKTGSSAIQRAFTEARDGLLAAGYLYPDLCNNFRAVMRGRITAGNAGALFQALRDDGGRDAIGALLEPVARDPRHLVLSCEGISNLPHRRLEVLRDVLDSLGYRARCLVFFRPQADVMVSLFLQRTKSQKRKTASVDEFVEQWLASGNMQRWDWHSRALKLEGAFGADAVTVKWYPAVLRAGPPGVVAAAFSWLGLPAPDARSSKLVVNPTPNAEALLVIEALNDAGLGGKRVADTLLARAQEAGLLGGKVVLGAHLRARVEAVTRQANVELLRRYCPELSAEEELRPQGADRAAGVDRARIDALTALAETLLLDGVSPGEMPMPERRSRFAAAVEAIKRRLPDAPENVFNQTGVMQ